MNRLVSWPVGWLASWRLAGWPVGTQLFQKIFGRSAAMEHDLIDAMVDAQKALGVDIANTFVHHVDKVTAFPT